VVEPTRNTPADPASRYARREYGVALNDVVGWTAAQVLAQLGEPNEKSEGRTWSSSDYKTFARDHAGKIREIAVFGIVPKKIPVGAAYETWAYQNVRGATWLLFIAQEKQCARVIEVGQYPTGAVF
jgi:hypothetical protein